jgi:DNA-binding response OmpR family regulator
MAEARILVVDDEPKLVHLVTEVLTATGFAVLSTAKGEDAIAMVAVEQPDLMVLDIALAGKTVFEKLTDERIQVKHRVKGSSSGAGA